MCCVSFQNLTPLQNACATLPCLSVYVLGPTTSQLAGQLMSSTSVTSSLQSRFNSTNYYLRVKLTISLCTGSLEAKWSCCSLLGTSQTESWVQA